MSTMFFSFPLYFLILGIQFVFAFNDFPSLMTANASMAIVIEKTFYERKVLTKEKITTTKDAYERSVASFASVVMKIARQEMNISGLSIHVFQDINTNLARNYMILLSVSTCQTAWNLFHEARQEKLVHLAITDIDCPRLPINEGMSIPLVDPGEELPQIFYDLRISRALDWKRANFLHDDSIDQETIGKIVRAFSDDLPGSMIGPSTKSLFSVKRGTTSTETKQNVENILSGFPSRTSLDDQFIVIVSHDAIAHVIEAARSLKMLHTKSQWLFVVPDMTNFSYENVTYLMDFLSEGENIAFLYNKTNFDSINGASCSIKASCYAREMVGAVAIALEKVLSIEIDLYDRVTEEEFETTGFSKMARSQNILEYLRDEIYNETKGLLNNGCGHCMKWVVASGLTWGNTIGSGTDLKSHELVETGVWTPDQSFMAKDHIFPHVFYGFRGKILPIATYHNPPWQYQTMKSQLDEEVTDVPRSEWDGLIFDVIKELSNKLNFTFKTVTAEMISAKNVSQKFSMSAAEKVPRDVIELVKTKSVFIGACAFTTSVYGKDDSINLTDPISIQTYGLLAATPEPQSRALLFTSPYSLEAWLCIILSIIVVGPVLYAVHKYSPRRIDDETVNVHNGDRVTLGSVSAYMWYIYGALLQQGGMYLPKTDGARLIVGSWWLVVMVVVATYSGSLVAFLTFPKMEPAIETVDDLLERRADITWSIPRNSLLDDYLTSKQASVNDYQNLLPENDIHGQKHDTVSYAKSVEKIKERKHVVIDWLSSLRISIRNDYQSSGRCHFSLGTDVLLLEEPIFMIVPAGSPYLGIINIQLQRMHESGLTNKWIANRMPMRDHCWLNSRGSSSTADNHKVDLHDMQGIFFVLFFGYTIGIIFLSFEYLMHMRQIARERKLITPFVE